MLDQLHIPENQHCDDNINNTIDYRLRANVSKYQLCREILKNRNFLDFVR